MSQNINQRILDALRTGQQPVQLRVCPNCNEPLAVYLEISLGLQNLVITRDPKVVKAVLKAQGG